MFQQTLFESEPSVNDEDQSPIEALLARALIVQGVSYESQYQIGPDRVDFAIPASKLVIECDGHNYHSTKKQRIADAQRDRRLIQRGWTVIRFTGSEINAYADWCAFEILRHVQYSARD